MKQMNVVFMGTPDISAVCLERILKDGFHVSAVYTKPDKPVGRGNKIAQSPVKQLALQYGIPVFQPDKLRSEEVLTQLREAEPDVIAVVAYGKILPQSVLDIPKIGCINIHGSLLPALRGSGPVQWSILNHFDETGVTAMFMSAGVDSGDIISQKKLKIDPMETSGELMERIAVIGAELLSETLTQAEKGPLPRMPQDDTLATFAPMLEKSMAPIDFSLSKRDIIDHIRGLQPWPVATALIDGKTFKVYRAEAGAEDCTLSPGTPVALTKKGLEIACGNGTLIITELQAEGGKRMSSSDYFRGHPIHITQ